MSLARNKDPLASRIRGDRPKIGSPTGTRSRRRQRSHLQTKARSLRRLRSARRHGGRRTQTLLQRTHPNPAKERAAAKAAGRARSEAKIFRPVIEDIRGPNDDKSAKSFASIFSRDRVFTRRAEKSLQPKTGDEEPDDLWAARRVPKLSAPGEPERLGAPIASLRRRPFHRDPTCLRWETKTVWFSSPCRSPSDPFFRCECLKVLCSLDYYGERPMGA